MVKCLFPVFVLAVSDYRHRSVGLVRSQGPTSFNDPSREADKEVCSGPPRVSWAGALDRGCAR